ncbi:MAG: S9 family peptidase [Bacteroidota bacterium]
MKKILSAILIGLLVFNIVAQDKEKTFTLENIVKKSEFRPDIVSGLKSLRDGKHYLSIEEGNILVYSYKSGELTDTLVDAKELIPKEATKPLKVKEYSLCSNEEKVLIPAETENIYRHSTKSSYYIWDISKKELNALSENGKQRLADFSPDGTKVAFVRNNNLFIKDLENQSEVRITSDGEDRHIINGTTDWVYEEEFSFTKGFFWSPGGKYIAYYKFDESNVVEYEMQMWGELYPESYKYKYPKAGESNSRVSIHFYDVENKTTISADIGQEADQYIPRIKWTKKSDRLAVQRMNRLQNHLEILLVDAGSGKSRVIYDETNKYYIEITDHLTFTDEEHFLITSEADGYNHIYLCSLDGKMTKQLSSGKWDVTDIKGFDSKRKLIFFEAAKSSPLNRDLLSVNLKGNMKLLSAGTGTNNANFSSNYDYYINTYTDANTPPYITLNRYNGKVVRLLKDNKVLMDKLQDHAYQNREFFTIHTAEGVDLNAWKIMPNEFDTSKQYPVLMYVYGGPGSQTVQNNWNDGQLWYQMLAQQGIVCISVDNRGTGGRGEEFKKMTYLQLGKYETIDQVSAASYLAALPWVDEEHIGIFGWSYGGFMASLCMTKGAGIFDVGVAVAPVTNWKYYDNIYTERFMRMPIENPDGYADNSPINFTDQLTGKYMLVHGTADDNVHVQNTIDLISALVASDKDFDLMLYPNKNHGIYGGNTRYHLFKRITNFLVENLK